MSQIKKVTIKLSAALHQALKIEAARRGLTMTQIVEEALKPYRDIATSLEVKS